MPPDEPIATVRPGHCSIHDRCDNGNEGGVEGEEQVQERSGAEAGALDITPGGGEVAETQQPVAALGNEGLDVQGEAGLE